MFPICRDHNGCVFHTYLGDLLYTGCAILLGLASLSSSFLLILWCLSSSEKGERWLKLSQWQGLVLVGLCSSWQCKPSLTISTSNGLWWSSPLSANQRTWPACETDFQDLGLGSDKDFPLLCAGPICWNIHFGIRCPYLQSGGFHHLLGIFCQKAVHCRVYDLCLCHCWQTLRWPDWRHVRTSDNGDRGTGHLWSLCLGL